MSAEVDDELLDVVQSFVFEGEEDEVDSIRLNRAPFLGAGKGGRLLLDTLKRVVALPFEAVVREITEGGVPARRRRTLPPLVFYAGVSARFKLNREGVDCFFGVGERLFQRVFHEVGERLLAVDRVEVG